jgi:hypothetical protein
LVGAKQTHEETGQAARVFRELRYQTRETWTRERRVVGKAEYLSKGANPRFVVTSLGSESWEVRALYEELYCQRGEMENRVAIPALLGPYQHALAMEQSTALVSERLRLCTR